MYRISDRLFDRLADDLMFSEPRGLRKMEMESPNDPFSKYCGPIRKTSYWVGEKKLLLRVEMGHGTLARKKSYCRNLESSFNHREL